MRAPLPQQQLQRDHWTNSPLFVASIFVVVGLLATPCSCIHEAIAHQRGSPKEFLDAVVPQLEEQETKEERLWYLWATNITPETEQAALAAAQKSQQLISQVIQNSTAYESSLSSADEDTRRQFKLLKQVTEPPLKNASKNKEFGEIIAKMTREYSSWEICVLEEPKSQKEQKQRPNRNEDNSAPEEQGPPCNTEDLQQVRKVLASSRNYTVLQDLWKKWRLQSSSLQEDYARFVDLSNEGAKEIGFKDTKELWLSRYDMEPEEMMRVVDALWDDLKPVYTDLHCHVRHKLEEAYRDQHHFGNHGMLEAHLLGNMWAQDWSNIYDIVAPDPSVETIDITAAMNGEKASNNHQHWNWSTMVHQAESFFTSLGLPPLPANFWDKSMFLQPRAPRRVVCHASAWDLGKNRTTQETEVRLKICIAVNQEFLNTVHHELGHIFYYMEYAGQPFLYRSGANDGFHEGIGDTMALSITPEYLKRLRLLPDNYDESSPSSILNSQMKVALDKVAFLPFGLLVDKFRWTVFSSTASSSSSKSLKGIDEINGGKGVTTKIRGPEDYQKLWWELRQEIQGVAPPLDDMDRMYNTSLFDAAAKSHICDNTPYLRYFLAYIIQFQFHKALCDAAGYQGPLHSCSINGSRAAGDALKSMLSLGQSKPWQDALQQLTGSPKMSAQPFLEYFEPLRDWLKEQNKNRKCGWTPTNMGGQEDKSNSGYWLTADRAALLVLMALAGTGVVCVIASMYWHRRKKRRQQSTRRTQATGEYEDEDEDDGGCSPEKLFAVLLVGGQHSSPTDTAADSFELDSQEEEEVPEEVVPLASWRNPEEQDKDKRDNSNSEGDEDREETAHSEGAKEEN